MRNLMLKILVTTGLLTLNLGCASRGHSAKDESAENQATTLLQIRGVEVGEDHGQTVVKIQSNGSPKYNIFKLSDPDKIVVDVMDAELAEGAPTSVSGQGGVKEIKAQALADSLSSIVRFEILVGTSPNYVANADEGSLAIHILGGAPSETPVASDSAASPIPQASTEAKSTDQPTDKTNDKPSDKPIEKQEALAEAPPAMPEASPAPVAAPSPEATTSEPPVAASIPETTPPVPLPVPVPPVPVPEAPEPAAPEPKVEIEKKDDSKPEETQSSETQEASPVPPSVVEKKVADDTPPVRAFPTPNPLQPVATQDIPTSGLTVGTSLLSEMDSKIYTGKRVTLEFQDADVQDILRLIADVSKLNIITADDVKGTLTLKLVDVPWDQALDIVLTTLGLDKVQHGNIIRVAPVEKLKKEREVALANDKAAKQLEPLRLKLINVNYATAEDMAGRIKNLLSERGTVDTDGRTNTLIVKDIREHLSRIENLIKALDTQTPQVRIEARIVEATDTFERSLGIQWGPALTLDEANNKARGITFPRNIDINSSQTSQNPPLAFPGHAAGSALANFAVDALPGAQFTGGDLGFRLGSIHNIFNLDLHLQYSELNSESRIISRPSISVLDNKTAHIIQGTKIPFTSSSSAGTNVQFQDAGIEITVTPQITNDGSVIMKINTKSNQPTSTSIGGNIEISIREATTEMLLKSGHTGVLGGVFKTSDDRGSGGVPGLMDIPVLGWLFKEKSKSLQRDETLVFITPYILNDSKTASTAPSSESQLDP